ncbi:MAG: class I tRNA ligase family protein, partial [Gammaproteobacteria bacterium]|nr:class I tRNA ligase family protein [Gammaproteobacteria bacterium]
AMDQPELSGACLVIWTTTPWTLPANQAVAVHPDLSYVLVNADDRLFIVAEDLLTTVMTVLNISTYQILNTVLGNELKGLILQHPFYSRKVPVVLSSHVTADTGTGIVHIAPSHGDDDFRVGKENGLNLETILGDDGCYVPSTDLFAGLHVSKANDAVMQTLKEKGVLLHQSMIEHSYPHCWRHKSPLIFRATPQWFIRLDKHHLREHALEAVNQVQWIPATGFNRISAMINNSPDWCISRQRTWGVPLALFLHKDTHELHPKTEELLEKIAERVERAGIQAWFDLDPEELLGDDATRYEKSKDTLDVWLDSGVSHECVLRQRSQLRFPADLYLEGSDQHRGWFQSSLLSSLAISGQAPYNTVLTHGFVVDERGYKMSKSIGNVIEPEDVLKNYGADILRLWIASTDYPGEITFSTEILKRTADVYRRIRNTARYLLSTLNDFNPALDKVALKIYCCWINGLSIMPISYRKN